MISAKLVVCYDNDDILNELAADLKRILEKELALPMTSELSDEDLQRIEGSGDDVLVITSISNLLLSKSGPFGTTFVRGNNYYDTHNHDNNPIYHNNPCDNKGAYNDNSQSKKNSPTKIVKDVPG